MIKGWYVLDDHPQDLACDCQVDLEEAYEDDWTVCNQESVVGVFCFIMLYNVVFLLISPHFSSFLLICPGFSPLNITQP